MGDVTVEVVLATVITKGFKIFTVVRNKFTTVAMLYFKRANIKLLRELPQCPQASAFEGLGVCECWSVLKNHCFKAQEKPIPLCLKSIKRGRRPA